MKQTTTKQTITEQIGIVLDCSADSANTLNERTISLAEDYGFKFEPLPDEDNEDYSQILSETSDDAVDFLNDLDGLPHCSFYFEDNSLFYLPCIENVREDIDFVSSTRQEQPDDDFRGEWLHVNDHGNATLYVRNDKGEDNEIWSLV
jgi:hypothetical protein